MRYETLLIGVEDNLSILSKIDLSYANLSKQLYITIRGGKRLHVILGVFIFITSHNGICEVIKMNTPRITSSDYTSHDR